MRIAARLLPVLAAVVSLLTAAQASGAVRSAQIDDGIDNQDTTPSLTTKPTIVEIVSAHVDYDEDGTVTASVTYNMPPGDDAGATLSLDGAAACADTGDGTDGPPQLRIRLVASQDYMSYPPGPPRSTVMLEGFDSSVSAPTQISADGLTLSATFAHSAFAHRDYRCVTGNGGRLGTGDAFSGYFAGFGPQRMVPKQVTAAMNAELAKRYGKKWTQGAGKWSICPKDEVGEGDAEDGSDAFGLCEFRFKDGARWRHGDMSFKLVDDYLTVDYFGSSTFTKALKTCHIRRNLKGYDPQILDRHLRADGYVSCHDGSASMIRDVHYLKPGIGRVGFHGTNRAGFEDAVAFRCVIKARRGGRRTAKCANKLGDRFIYSYIQRPKPKRRARPKATQRTSCDSNYSGACLKPNASDYDCEGGGGDGPYYVNGPITVVGDDHYDLDADGNGTACE